MAPEQHSHPVSLIPGVAPSARPIVRESLTYTASYCEENIYLILRDYVDPSQLDQYTVVFISNTQKCVPLFYQRIAQGNLPVCWDYHVILLHTSPITKLTSVYDFDTQLTPFPLSFRDYFLPTLNGPSPWPSWPVEVVEAIQETISRNPRRYKLIKGRDYLRLFASSRRHMLKKILSPLRPSTAGAPASPTGEVGEPAAPATAEVEIYVAPPPLYPPIRTEESECTLQKFLDFSPSWSDCDFGRIVDEWAFLNEFSDQNSTSI
ncbi:N-terminal glutamine amidase-domain-containing protein [Kalaharituber pfeilii]|nr:N-terminal glutamine amidase-domain-containing protein [Kalaharituber pfeilii]